MSRKGNSILSISACAFLLIGSLASAPGSARAKSLTGGQSPRSLLAEARAEARAFMGPKSGSLSRSMPPLASRVPGPQVDPSCWTQVSSPSPSADNNQLVSASAASPGDVWAVGSYCASDCYTENEVDRALIEHFDGNAWSIVPAPHIDTTFTWLSGVSAVNRKDAWVSGYYFDGTRLVTLTEHWNGTEWSILPSPNPGTRNNYLFGIAALSPDNVWAVGTYRPDPSHPLSTLVEHYDGTAWTVVPSPSPGTGRSVLNSVTALSPNNIWAAGLACDDNGCTQNPRTLIEHWNGSEWTVVPSPSVGIGQNSLVSISGSQPNDIWAVGYYCGPDGCGDPESGVLIEHYNGVEWSIVPSPVASPYSALWGVTARTPRDVWIAGSYSADGGSWTNLLLHYDGTGFQVVPTNSPGAFNNDLYSVAAIGNNHVWAVGDSGDTPDYPFSHTQIQRYYGPCR